MSKKVVLILSLALFLVVSYLLVTSISVSFRLGTIENKLAASTSVSQQLETISQRLGTMEDKLAASTSVSQPLGRIEDNRVIFDKSELSVINDSGVLLNLYAKNGPVGIRFFKDYVGNPREDNPWHMGYIERLKGYQGLAILRDFLFTAALWDEDGRLTVGRLNSYPPGNQPANARFEVRGMVDEVQAMVVAPKLQTDDIFQVVSNKRTEMNESTPFDVTKYFAVDGKGNTIIGSPDDPKEVILYDTADGTPYSLQITNGNLSITKVVDGAQ